MKKLLLLLLCVPLIGLGQVDIESKEEIKPTNVYYEDDIYYDGVMIDKTSNLPLNGLVISIDEMGGRREVNYKEGKYHGSSKYYFKTGQLNIDGNYRNGEYHGLFIRYYKNGKLQMVGEYKDGVCISSIYSKENEFSNNKPRSKDIPCPLHSIVKDGVCLKYSKNNCEDHSCCLATKELYSD